MPSTVHLTGPVNLPCVCAPPPPGVVRALHEPWVATTGWEVVAACVLVTVATTGWIVHRYRRGVPAGSIAFGVAGMAALAAASMATGLFMLQPGLVTFTAAALTSALCSGAWRLVALRHPRPDTEPAGAADRSEQAASVGAGRPAPTPDTIHPPRKADLS